MNKPLTIVFDWLSKDSGCEIEDAFYAGIRIAVGNEYLTRLDDRRASTVRTDVRADAHRLAMWLAMNWWRLRWEPAIASWQTDVDWQMAHNIASAGGGFVWPTILFASDGDSLAIAAKPTRSDNGLQTVRYLSDFVTRVSAVEFEKSIDLFIESVVSRSSSVGISDQTLDEIWSEVQLERRDASTSRFRKLEALCGYDPGNARSEMIESLVVAAEHFSISAVDEVAAAERQFANDVLNDLKNVEHGDGIQAEIPSLNLSLTSIPGERPWQSARRFAQSLRSELGLMNQPISDATLAGLMKMKADGLSDRRKSNLPFPFALRSTDDSCLDVFLTSPWRTNRRFAVARLLGDLLRQENSGQLMPATKAKTERQQFQRAFAQEFLCPYESLLSSFSNQEPDEEDLQNAAEYFEVSPMVIQTTLLNKGELDREAFNPLTF
jgi:hypothetical protein